MHKNSVLTWKVCTSHQHMHTSWFLLLKKWRVDFCHTHYSYFILSYPNVSYLAKRGFLYNPLIHFPLQYICDCVVAGHELRPSCRAGHLVTVATEPAFSKPHIKAKNGKVPDLNSHTHVSSTTSTSTSASKRNLVVDKKRKERPSCASSNSVAGDMTGSISSRVSTKKFGRPCRATWHKLQATWL